MLNSIVWCEIGVVGSWVLGIKFYIDLWFCGISGAFWTRIRGFLGEKVYISQKKRPSVSLGNYVNVK